jgi:hypothetical protein
MVTCFQGNSSNIFDYFYLYTIPGYLKNSVKFQNFNNNTIAVIIVEGWLECGMDGIELRSDQTRL